MALFRRRHRTDETAAVADFWAWWSETGAAELDAAIAAGDPAGAAQRLGRHLDAIDPGLEFELGPGRTSRHQLVVTAAGKPEQRAPARRWLRAAPPPDDTWEYADLRQPSGDLSGVLLRVGGADVAFSDVVVTARRAGARFDVVVFHPAFPDLPEEARLQITFLALDAALGEADVETWLGRIAPAEHAPIDAFALEHLRGLVTDLAVEHTDDQGEPSWTLLQGEGPRGPVLVLARTVLAPVQAPDLDRHVAVATPYADRTEHGFPGDASLEALRQLEDHLVARLGAGGLLAAVVTEAGVRTFHFYVDGSGPGQQVLTTAAGGWAEGRVKVTAEHDPGWHAVAPFRG